jgi:hypothetical protein
MRSYGSMCLVEATIGEIKSNDDVSGACRQLSIALAVIERAICVLAAPRVSAEAARVPVLQGAAGTGGGLRRHASFNSETVAAALAAHGAFDQGSDTIPLAPFYRALELKQRAASAKPAVVPAAGGADGALSRDETVSISSGLPADPVLTPSPSLAFDYRLTGLIFAAKASAAYAEGRGLELASDVRFVDRSKIHICLSG